MQRQLTISVLATLLPAIPAAAGIVQIDDAGSFLLSSSSMPGLFDGDSMSFPDSSLAAVHDELWDWGIDTDGHITILPVDTNTGLSILVLIDRELGGGDTGMSGALGAASTAPGGRSLFINDSDQDSWTLIEPPFGSQTLGATFLWGSAGSGDGFAWSGLITGDTFSFTFNDLTGDGDALDDVAFQFVGWDMDDGWGVMSTAAFKSSGDYVFSGQIIPAPPAALLLAGLALTRRRRSA